MVREYHTQNTYDIDPALLAAPERLTPMMSQYLATKKQAVGAVLLYQMGDFYETFLEDALICSRLLGLTLTGRDAGVLGHIPLAGFQLRGLSQHLPTLLKAGFKVAVCEQQSEVQTQAGKPLVSRAITRILSPGTLTEESLLRRDEHQLLAACTRPVKGHIGLAYADVSTGQLWATECEAEGMLTVLGPITPVELIVPARAVIHGALKGLRHTQEWQPDVSEAVLRQYCCTPLEQPLNDASLTQRVCEWFEVRSLDGFGLKAHPLAQKAVGMLLVYLEQMFPKSRPVFRGVQWVEQGGTVGMTAETRKSLELCETWRDGLQQGSLLGLLNHTQTPMGGRLLRQWINQPLTRVADIQARLDGVAELMGCYSRVAEALRGVYDLDRLGARLANLTATARDVVALADSIDALEAVAQQCQAFQSFHLLGLEALPEPLRQLRQQIVQALLPNPAMALTEGQLFHSAYHPQLAEYRQALAEHQHWLEAYEAQEREACGLKTLKLGHTHAFGYYLELSKTQAPQAPEHFKRKQTLAQCERYTTVALSQQEQRYVEALTRMGALEYQLFVAFRQGLLPCLPVLQQWSARVATLDVLQGFAAVAYRYHYTRPTITDEPILDIQEGCHPVLQAQLPMGQTMPNSCQLSAGQQSLALITGPNMAGKSTYMRQVALLVLMAQMGSFIPAQSACIGVVDQLFTRVGAVDDLSRGQSTFMVEMTDVAQILHGATHRSLVLLDEVGRGTSTYDGVALATSIAEALVRDVGCRTLFSTHYHELSQLQAQYPTRIQNLRAMVSEQKASEQSATQLIFTHRLEPGAAQKSYGLAVARMAGVPAEVLTRAQEVLDSLEQQRAEAFGALNQKNQHASTQYRPVNPDQLQLFLA